MNLELQELRGLRVLATATAFPIAAREVPGSVRNEEVYEHLFGSTWREELTERSFDANKPAEAWGVTRRAWGRWPGKEVCSSQPSLATELATRASRSALEQASLTPSEIDLLVVGGSTPARISRSTASLVAADLQCNAACFDVKSGGASGLSAWLTAASLLKAGAKRALVVASEVPSAYLATSDLVGCLLYGDGAAAVLLERDSNYPGGLVSGAMGTRQATGVPFTIPGNLPPTRAGIEAGEYLFHREDPEYREQLAREWRDVARNLRTQCRVADWFLPYGVHAAQVQAAADEFGSSPENTRTTLQEHGCIGCAGPLAALHELCLDGNGTPGATIATCAVAGGIHWVGFHWEL